MRWEYCRPNGLSRSSVSKPEGLVFLGDRKRSGIAQGSAANLMIPQ